MFKGWIVKTKNIKFEEKGCINYFRYLQNEKHKNHLEKTKIIPIWGHDEKDNVLMNMILSNVKTDAINKINGKGGKPIKNYRKSFCFSLPPQIHPTKKQWYEISSKIYQIIRKDLKVKPEELKKISFLNIHDEEKPHLNLMMSQSLVDGTRLRRLKDPSFLNLLKKTFNLTILEVMGVSHQDYQPKQQKPTKTNDKSIYLNKLKNLLKDENKEELREEFKLQEKFIDKTIKLFFTYKKRYEDAKNKNEIAKMEKHKKDLDNLIEKSKDVKPLQDKFIKDLPYKYNYPSM